MRAVPGQELVQELLSLRHLVREPPRPGAAGRRGRSTGGCRRAARGRSRPRRCTPRAPRGRRSPASRTSSSSAPGSCSKSRDDSGPSARIRSSTRSATSALSARAASWKRRPFRPDADGTRELARRDERERLVRRLEDLAALVELVAPGGVVAGDARVQDEIVVPTGDSDRVELDRPELPQDREHGVRAALERARRREEVPRDEKAARVLFGDLHRADATATEGPSRRALGREEMALRVRDDVDRVGVLVRRRAGVVHDVVDRPVVRDRQA